MRISTLYRHPIKSARAQVPERITLDALGVIDDRRMMLIDDQGRFVTARTYAQLARCEVVRVVEGWRVSHPDRIGDELIFADAREELLSVEVWGDEFEARLVSARANEWFTKVLGTSLRLVAQAPETHRGLDPGFVDEERETVFSDGFPLLITNGVSLAALNDALDSPVDMLRFRPNIVVDAELAWDEDDWMQLEIGELSFACAKPCVRCSLTGVDPETGNRAAEPLRTLSRLRVGTTFGINLVHSGPGEIAVGDEVRVSKRRVLRPR